MSLSRIDRPPRPPASSSAGLAAAVALGAAALVVGTTLLENRRHNQRERARAFPDSAPSSARRAGGDLLVISNAVTIGRPRAELFAFWRDFENLPRFMENVRDVRVLDGGRSQWTIAGPAGTSFDILAEIVDEREGERIAWRSLPESDVETEGEVEFRDLPAGRGTAVAATVAYRPPGGIAGAWIAKLFGREPNIQGRRELRRLKMLMEAGEIATSANRRDPS
ncbi:MAG: SRPBCC family protein [Amaricoccus sp.]